MRFPAAESRFAGANLPTFTTAVSAANTNMTQFVTEPANSTTELANSGDALPANDQSLNSGLSPVMNPPVTRTVQLGFANGLAGWNVSEVGGSPEGRGTVTPGSAVLHEGDSFLVTLDQDVVIPAAPLSLEFTYEASFDTTDPDFINDAFEAALIDADGNPLVYTFAPQRDAYFNLTEQLSSALGRGTIEEVVEDGNHVSLDISQLAEGTEGTLVFRLVNNDSDEDTTVRILSVELISGDDSRPAVTLGLANDTAPSGPGTDIYLTDKLTNDPTLQGTAVDDDQVATAGDPNR